MNMKLVLAANFDNFLYWCQKNNLKPYEQARYIGREKDILGYNINEHEVVYCGEYWRNPEWVNLQRRFKNKLF